MKSGMLHQGHQALWQSGINAGSTVPAPPSITAKLWYCDTTRRSNIVIEQGLQTTARGPSPAHEAVSSGRKYSLSVMKQYIYETFVDMLECNISRNNHIA